LAVDDRCWKDVAACSALEESNIVTMHPEGGIMYQTPPGRRITVIART
jgi:hypothetical protein